MYGSSPTVTARYIAERSSAGSAASSGPTSTAPTTQLARALAMSGLSPRPADRLWGAIPVEEVEGHQVDPAYDVRPIEGLGRGPIRPECLAGLGLKRFEDERDLVERQGRVTARYLGRPSSFVRGSEGDGVAASADPSETMEGRAAASSAPLELGGLLPLAVLAGALMLLGGRR